MGNWRASWNANAHLSYPKKLSSVCSIIIGDTRRWCKQRFTFRCGQEELMLLLVQRWHRAASCHYARCARECRIWLRTCLRHEQLCKCRGCAARVWESMPMCVCTTVCVCMVCIMQINAPSVQQETGFVQICIFIWLKNEHRQESNCCCCCCHLMPLPHKCHLFPIYLLLVVGHPSAPSHS